LRSRCNNDKICCSSGGEEKGKGGRGRGDEGGKGKEKMFLYFIPSISCFGRVLDEG